MILLRILLVAFNVAVFALLVFRLFKVAQSQMEGSRKRIIVAIAVLLLVVPVAMLLRFVPATPVYLLLYPVAISCFLYLVRLST